MSERWPGGIISQTAPVPSGPYQDSTAPGIWTMEQAAYWRSQGNWPTPGSVNPSAFIENLFQTWLYTGNGSTQTITNGIDLSGNGGLVWIKRRDSAVNHYLATTVGGTSNYLNSNTTSDYETGVTTRITSFNAGGFSIGSAGSVNNNGSTFASWTFREQPKFFDIVTYTGNGSGSGRTISHNLGSVPGMMILKVTNLAGDDWYVYHRSIPTRLLALNSANSTDPTPPQFIFGNGTTAVAPTSTEFTIGSTVNGNGYTFIVYLFAHDAGGFGLSGNENVISCGSFTSDGSGFASVNLGYEPQWLLVKRTDGANNWWIADNMRGLTAPTSNYQMLQANTSIAETTATNLNINATGFTSNNAGLAGMSFIYMAIRRGPMAVPTLGTSVFIPVAAAAGSSRTITTNFPVDMVLLTDRSTSWVYNTTAEDRLRGGTIASITSSTNAERTDNASKFDSNVSFLDEWSNLSANNIVYETFRRAPGFFDVVCYTGNSTAGRTVTHNLGAVPELMIVKARNAAEGWQVYSSSLGNTKYLQLNSDAAEATATNRWNNTSPTSSVFTLGTSSSVNFNTYTYVAYLFASVNGVSKVGSYSGTGATQTINCGFTSGARFVLIKRTNDTGNWFVWDTARGMVAGTDPFLLLNTTDAESNINAVYTVSTGFQIVSTNAELNASGSTYIFLAIA